jgi:aryl-alcohol dehydrogenase-like predicted oxidoreductase
MQERALGGQGMKASAIGLGCMGMSGSYGPSDDAESIATIHAAMEAGVSLLDTGDFYGMGHNEMLIGQALRGKDRSKVLLAVKFGSLRDWKGNFLGQDCRPAAIKSFLSYSLQRLGTDYIDFYFPSRIDRSVPIEDSIGAMAELVKEGKLRYLGLSEASAATLERAHRVHPITALEYEYSIASRDLEDSHGPTLRRLGIGVLAYGVLSRGLLSGTLASTAGLGERDFRRHSPRYQAGNIEKNLALVEGLKGFARAKGCTVSQLCFAWVLAQGPDIVPLLGTKNPGRLQEGLGALELKLSAEDLAQLEGIFPKGAMLGERYPAPAMASLNG